MSSSVSGRLNLLIDADDTLWDNNVYFERAIASFISFLNHQEFNAEQVREVLNHVERECIVSHGYGLHSFTQALVRTFEHLSAEPVTAGMHQTICGIAQTIAEQPIELLPYVAETLDDLSQRHRLVLVTKGAREEQTRKIDGSGLARYFSALEIVPEKDESAYHDLCRKHGLDKELTWMIGNSPKSDINPALRAGLNAIFIPHGNTWILEHEELAQAPAQQTLLVLDAGFSELRRIL